MKLTIHTNNYFADKVKQGVKKHFIVDSENDFYELGDTIEIRDSFNKLVKKFVLENMQDIEIVYSDDIYVKVDGKTLDLETLKQLAINDGFTDLLYFYSVYNKNLKGKILHLTDLKY